MDSGYGYLQWALLLPNQNINSPASLTFEVVAEVKYFPVALICNVK